MKEERWKESTSPRGRGNIAISKREVRSALERERESRVKEREGKQKTRERAGNAAEERRVKSLKSRKRTN